jgi:elongation factor G
MDPPQAGYRETISQVAEADYSHRQTTGDGEHLARVKVMMEPQNFRFDIKSLKDVGGFEFNNLAANSAVPEKYIPAVEKGILKERNAGCLLGFPIIGLKLTLVDGTCYEASSSMAFELATRAAFREAVQRASPVLLEPLLTIDLASPEDYLGDIIGDLNSRRGSVTNMGTLGDARTVKAIAPAANIFGFPTTFAHQTQNRGVYSLRFSYYERVPSSPGNGPPWPEAGAAALSA